MAEAQGQFLRAKVRQEDVSTRAVRTFAASLGLPAPSPEEVAEFRNTYNNAAQVNKRAEKGAVESLVRLRENGVAVVTIAKATAAQLSMIDTIGIRDLVDRVFTSDQIGPLRADGQAFLRIVVEMGARQNETIVVGDDPLVHAKAASRAGLRLALFSPDASGPRHPMHRAITTLIKRISDFLGFCGISKPAFRRDVVQASGRMFVDGLGFDIVLGKRQQLHICREFVLAHALDTDKLLRLTALENRGAVFVTVSRMESAIKRLCPSSEYYSPVFPTIGDMETTLDSGWTITNNTHSIRAIYRRMVAPKPQTALMVRRVVELLQDHFNSLMSDDPRAALEDLRTIINMTFAQL